MSSTPKEITKELLEKTQRKKSEKKTFEEIKYGHFQACQKYKVSLGLTDADMDFLYSQGIEDLVEDMLKMQRIKFLKKLEKENSEKISGIISELNKKFQPWEIVFNLHYNNILSVSIYRQKVYEYYLTKIDKDFVPIDESSVPTQEKIIKLIKAYEQGKHEDYLEIENLKKLAENFKKLFVESSLYHRDVTDKSTAKNVLSGKQKGLTLLAPHPDSGFDIRMYTLNSKGKVKAFSLGFTLSGKVTFVPDWWSEQDQIILNKEKATKEYDTVGDLIQANKKYFIFRLENDHPDDLKDRPGDFLSEEQLAQWIKLQKETENLLDEELIERIKKQSANLQKYELLGYPQPKVNFSVQSSSQNCCAM